MGDCPKERKQQTKEWRGLCGQRYKKAMREDTKHSVFTIDQLSWNVEFGVGLGPGFKEKKLKQFSSTSHENKSQEEAAQLLVHNAQAPNNKYP